jgi:hypothetical protein
MGLKLALSRARYAAIGAAIGAGLGGLISRNAASTGGAVGALVGATLGETRISVGDKIENIRSETSERVPGASADEN